MIVVHTPHHILHNPPKEFISNQVMAYGESPERAELLFESLMDYPGVKLERAQQFDLDHFVKIHDPGYLNYLQTAYDDWVAEGLWNEGILPEFFAIGRIRKGDPPQSQLGKAGYYMTDSCTMIVKGTWEAVKYSGFTALTGAHFVLQGQKGVFSLCRPPGHHAGYDFAGGYCFVNNAALAARYLQDNGLKTGEGKRKIGILDIDFHHGNGTQDIVRQLEDIFFVSIHGDPVQSYPYLSGYESENSLKNINYPLPPGMEDEAYFQVFRRAVADLESFGAEFLVLSLGVDTFEKDQLGNFRLTSGIYTRMAQYLIEDWKRPVLVIMEGGYNIEYLASNVGSFLDPFIRNS